MTARPLYKVNNSVSDSDRIASLERRLSAETARRKRSDAKYDEAVRQISRFHALLIAERIRHLQRKDP